MGPVSASPGDFAAVDRHAARDLEFGIAAAGSPVLWGDGVEGVDVGDGGPAGSDGVYRDGVVVADSEFDGWVLDDGPLWAVGESTGCELAEGAPTSSDAA